MTAHLRGACCYKDSITIDRLRSELRNAEAPKTCYCEIGAGGTPCVSLEHCDKYRGLSERLSRANALLERTWRWYEQNAAALERAGICGNILNRPPSEDAQ